MTGEPTCGFCLCVPGAEGEKGEKGKEKAEEFESEFDAVAHRLKMAKRRKGPADTVRSPRAEGLPPGLLSGGQSCSPRHLRLVFPVRPCRRSKC